MLETRSDATTREFEREQAAKQDGSVQIARFNPQIRGLLHPDTVESV